MLLVYLLNQPAFRLFRFVPIFHAAPAKELELADCGKKHRRKMILRNFVIPSVEIYCILSCSADRPSCIYHVYVWNHLIIPDSPAWSLCALQSLWIQEAGDAEWKWDTELWIRKGTSAFGNNLAPDSSADEFSCISVFILTILLSPPPSFLPWPDLFDLSNFCVDCEVISTVWKPHSVLMHKLDSIWYWRLGVGSMLE